MWKYAGFIHAKMTGLVSGGFGDGYYGAVSDFFLWKCDMCKIPTKVATNVTLPWIKPRVSLQVDDVLFWFFLHAFMSDEIADDLL